MISRRAFTQIALAGAASLPAWGGPDSKVKGVRLGAQSYSFRDMPLDDAIKAMSTIGLSYVELWSGHIEPKGLSREDMKKWRTSPEALTLARDVQRKFSKAGIRIYAFNYSFNGRHSDEEVLHGMEMAKLMRTKIITASSQVDQAVRLNGLAGKAGVKVAMHNHSNLKNPNEFATPESFAKAVEGNENILINFDIGHYTAANFDAVDFLKRNHQRIVTVHIKDRKKNQGENVPFGTGDTPIREVLAFLRNSKSSIPAMIEYEYKSPDTVAEVRKCLEYCKTAILEAKA